jgi:gliding motility-associated-like protein
MFYKKKLLLFLFLSLYLKALPAVFTVTSNADAGPGTLREAITLAAANGSSAIDYIYFNLPDLSEAGRTIVLATQLPDLSSNLVIDGTTQPGVEFGFSNAHVEISTPKTYDAFITFKGSGLNDVEFYGLYIYDYYDCVTSYPGLQQRKGIKLANCSNVIIGAPGKGNLVRGFNIYCLDIDSTDNIKVKSNIIGLGESNTIGNDGSGYNAGYTGLINIAACNNIYLGGDTGDGNIIFTMVNLRFNQQTINNTAIIGSNNFGVYQDGVSTEWYFEFYRHDLEVYTDFSNNIKTTDESRLASAAVDINIYNNLSGSQSGIFSFQYIKGSINFTKNYFNVGRDGISDVKYLNQITPPQQPIYIAYCSAHFNIGTNNIGDKNFFFDSEIAIDVDGDPNVFGRFNDYKCVSIAAYTNNIADTIYSIPQVNIQGVTRNGNVTHAYGTSEPGATIDIYSSESCQSHCSIRSYQQTVTADNSGQWQADILNADSIFYVSASLDNQTSLFRTLQINTDNLSIQPIRCNNTGSITGLNVPQGVNYYWTDDKGNIVSTDLNLITQKAGNYQLVLAGGCITSPSFKIENQSFIINDSSLTITNTGCSSDDGSVNNLTVYDPLAKITGETWTDGSGKVIGTSSNISNLKAGNYIFTVYASDGCSKTYGPVVIKNTTGPMIDQSKVIVQSSNCGTSTGSISGITASGSGTLSYSWKNAQQLLVGSSNNLINVPAGLYTLEVTGDTLCGPVTISVLVPETNGIALDESVVIITSAGCGGSDGAVTGLKATGADQYQWTDATGKIVATTLDFKNAVPGDYLFTASNIFGCSKTTKVYHVGQLPVTQFPSYDSMITNACFAQNNGSVSIMTDASVKSSRWVNSIGQTVGIGSHLAGLGGGSYQLYLTDQNGCENLYNTYVISASPQLQIVSGSEHITNDECNLKTGSLNGIQVSGGFPPYTYLWENAVGEIIALSANLSGVGSGTYTLRVNDTRNCGQAYASYSVQNQSNGIIPPVVNDVKVCGPGDALVKVNDPQAAFIYRIYNSITDQKPLQQQASGRFTMSIKGHTTFYLSQLSGTCESARTAVQISVGISATDIPNAFTPNGDGINDYWKIPGIENYPGAVVQVFNRYGQQVFESKGYTTFFDGRLKGRALPSGVYYYVINLSSGCSILSGNLLLIR